MKKYLIFILIFLPYIVLSQTFIKEYTYRASEKDSKVDARNNTMLELKKMVIEEVGTLVITDTYLNKDDEITINSKTRIISESITKTKILDEQWDGYKYYMKVEIFIDKKDLENRLKRIQLEYYNNRKEYNPIETSNGRVHGRTSLENNNKGYDFISSELQFDYQPNLDFLSANFSINFVHKIFKLGFYSRKEISKIYKNKYSDSGLVLGLSNSSKNNKFLFKLPVKMGKGQITLDDTRYDVFIINPSLELGYRIFNIPEKNGLYGLLMIGIGYKYVDNNYTPNIDSELNLNGLNFSLGFNVRLNTK